MPPLNTVKFYVKGGYYHIYNRGVEKRDIFLDEQDYSVFLRLLKEYLLPRDHSDLIKLQSLIPSRRPVNCHDDIALLSYCLMPNHFHLFVKQKSNDGLKMFMKALATNYAMYFNSRYERTGRLFEGTYKAILITTEPYYLHISRYIHRNPIDVASARDNPLQFIRSYPYSSYKYYLKGSGPDWINASEILSLFRSSRNKFIKDPLSYQSFVESYKQNDREILGRTSLD